MVYVMSDIHGHSQRFESVMSQIKLKPEDTLYILGDVVDRSPDGIRLIRKFMKMPNVKMLLGNHEYMMLDVLLYPPNDKLNKFDRLWDMEQRVIRWYNNGGNITHNYLKHIRKDLRKEVLEFVDSLPLNYRIEVNGQKYILVHGGIEGDYQESFMARVRYDSEKEYCVWTRDARHFELPEDTILIFGHTPTNHFQDNEPMEIWKGQNRYGIDCGCGYLYPGRLACLRLDDMAVFYSEVEDEEDLKEKERLDRKHAYKTH